MVKNPNPQALQPDRIQSNDLFDVVVVVRNHQGNQLFRYYPKAGVIEVKRNKVWSQVTVSVLLERGVAALLEADGAGLVVSLPKVPEPSKALAIDE